MASLFLSRFRTDHDPDRPKKEVPKVAFYVLGAAFTLSTGLTLLILPYVRQAAKQARLAPPPIPTRSLRPIGTASGAAVEDTALRDPKAWTAKDDFTLVRSPGAPSMGNLLWLGIRALGIATAIVGAGASVGVVATAKLMGVTNMDEFNVKMREAMARSVPELAEMSRASLREEEGKEPTTWHDFLDDLLEEKEAKQTDNPT